MFAVQNLVEDSDCQSRIAIEGIVVLRRKSYDEE